MLVVVGGEDDYTLIFSELSFSFKLLIFQKNHHGPSVVLAL